MIPLGFCVTITGIHAMIPFVVVWIANYVKGEHAIPLFVFVSVADSVRVTLPGSGDQGECVRYIPWCAVPQV